jgi:hypothetical protein
LSWQTSIAEALPENEPGRLDIEPDVEDYGNGDMMFENLIKIAWRRAIPEVARWLSGDTFCHGVTNGREPAS